VASLPAGPSPVRVAFTPDGKYVLVPDRQANDLRVYDAASRAPLKTVAVCQGPGGVVTSPDGKTVYVACQASNEVNVIDAGTWAVIRTIPMGRGPDGLAVR
jgi:YVTN family beta-propeller protein